MLFRAIKHQVDKGPVDAVTGKAKYTLNDNRLLREDVEYKTLVRRPPHSLFHPHPGDFFFFDKDKLQRFLATLSPQLYRPLFTPLLPPGRL